ncbi:hypothetical protein P6709_20445, partial [Jeotgalibacillus sp. ET6]|uniref:hypothetical protein n=1 Tax=Jeotgalibacillus sp. ET6 TaxID=3037260 RepID=UPI002418745B
EMVRLPVACDKFFKRFAYINGEKTVHARSILAFVKNIRENKNNGQPDVMMFSDRKGSSLKFLYIQQYLPF